MAVPPNRSEIRNAPGGNLLHHCASPELAKAQGATPGDAVRTNQKRMLVKLSVSHAGVAALMR